MLMRPGSRSMHQRHCEKTLGTLPAIVPVLSHRRDTIRNCNVHLDGARRCHANGVTARNVMLAAQARRLREKGVTQALDHLNGASS
jgi:hypothetical protein